MTGKASSSARAAASGGADGGAGGVLVIGGGVAGVALALFLHRSGVRVRLYEAYRLLSDTAGLCLQLGANGVAVLEALQLEQRLLERGVRAEAFRIVDEGGAEMCTVPLHTKALYGNETVMVQRHRLHTLLAHALEAEGGQVAYGHELTAIEQSTDGAVTATFANGAVATGDVLVGCDGVHSRTRTLLFPSTPKTSYQGYLGVSALLPMSALTAEERGVMRLEEGVLNMTRGQAGVFLAAAAGNDAQGEPVFLVVIKLPLPLDVSSAARDMSNEQLLGLLRPLCGDWHPPLPRLLELMCAPSASPPLRWPSYCFDEELTSWHQGRAVLIGDAAHASVPDGQGASTALEDAQYLALLLADAYTAAGNTAPSPAALTAVFEQLHAHRGPRVQTINEEARSRNRQLVAGPLMGAWKAWLIRRIMPWLLWLMGARLFDSQFRFSYRIPGYRIVPPRTTQTGGGRNSDEEGQQLGPVSES